MVGSFVRKHDYLICVNSAGCVMNTRNRRHFHCYGPGVVLQWELEQWRIPVLERWNQVNLLRMSRGIHPFKALALVLSEVDRDCTPIAGVEDLRVWTEAADELSEENLAVWIQSMQDGDGRRCLEKALNWSKAARAGIAQIPVELMQPFPGAGEALAELHQMADVVVLSDDSFETVKEDWSRYDLLKFADAVLPCEPGRKHHCVATMLQFGYQPDHVLVVGDTPEDWDAAELNGVGFFPIVINQEAESWQELRTVGLEKLRGLSYQDYQPEAKQRFLTGLGAI